MLFVVIIHYPYCMIIVLLFIYFIFIFIDFLKKVIIFILYIDILARVGTPVTKLLLYAGLPATYDGWFIRHFYFLIINF